MDVEAREVVNLSEAARILGVSRPTVYRAIKDGILGPVRLLGKRYLFREEVELFAQYRKEKRGGNGCVSTL